MTKKEDTMDKPAVPDILRGFTLPEHPSIYVPIERIDKAKREVFGRATVEDVDSHKTIFSYDASKRAFTEWMREYGNIREMHDASRAVGKAVQVQFDDENKQVLVRARVSRSADGDNTWTKIEEGILTGFSVGASQGTWSKVERNGKQYPFLEDYKLVELSIVDHPSTPGCQIEVARADGFISDVIEPDDEQSALAETEVVEEGRAEEPEVERAGARVSGKTKTSLHAARDHGLMAAKHSAATCGCADCQDMAKHLDPDMDGDVDIVPSLDSDKDSDNGTGDGAALEKAVSAEITRQLTPFISRLNGIASRLSQVDVTRNEAPDISRRMETIEQRLTGLDEVRSVLAEVKGLTMRIAEQPAQVVGPLVNGVQRQMVPQNTRMSELAQAIRSGTANKDQQLEAASMLISEQLRQR